MRLGQEGIELLLGGRHGGGVVPRGRSLLVEEPRRSLPRECRGGTGRDARTYTAYSPPAINPSMRIVGGRD